MPRSVEAVVVAVVGALLATAAGSLVAGWLALGPWFVVVAAAVGGVNGLLSGWRRIYAWGCSDGFVALVLDSTWALLTTSSGLFAHAVAASQRDAGYAPSLSERRNQHVYRRGFVPRRGFAITLGNVVNGVGDTSSAPRRRLVTDHETVHCWQARWFGPLYPLLYVGWMVGGGAVGAIWWLLARRSSPLGRVVETVAYYLNPFEWWAYSRHGIWPPSGKVAGMGWRRPCCRPLAEVRGDRNRDVARPVRR